MLYRERFLDVNQFLLGICFLNQWNDAFNEYFRFVKLDSDINDVRMGSECTVGASESSSPPVLPQDADSESQPDNFGKHYKACRQISR